jgi:hypothetical protein
MISRSLFAAVWLASTALAGPPLTTIQDVLYKADGTRFAGTLTISWTSFEAIDTSAIASQATTVTVTDGNLRVQLVPTTTAVPAANYSVKYTSDGRLQFSETWAVPSSVGPLRVRDVRIASTQPGAAGAVVAPPTVQESDVAGLIADLGARPLKGAGYAAGRLTVVTPTGSLDSVTGSPSDCVRVDGSSGPCGSAQPAFVDGESPAGIVDGANTTFTLSAFPNPASSLAVYRNGVLQKLVQDYNFTGNSVQFVVAAAPQPGDTLLASYRLTDTSSPPQGLVSPQQINSAGLSAGQMWVWDGTSYIPGTGGSVGGGGGTWGSITGSLASQADLNTALGFKATLAAPVFTGQATIPDFTLAGHSHQNPAGGGSLDAAAIGSGLLAIARIPTGTTGTTAALGNHLHTGIYEPVMLPGTTLQFWRGDKSWQVLDTSITLENGNLYFTPARALAAVTWATIAGKPAAFVPSGHAASHQNGGADEVATPTPAANAIPKAGAGGTLAVAWIPTLNQSTTGNAATATNLAGGAAGQIPYQTAAGATGFRAPNVANGPLVLDASGNAVVGTTVPVPGGAPAGSVAATKYYGDGSALSGIVGGGAVASVNTRTGAVVIGSADIPNNAANTTGNAATASALDHLPAPCTGGLAGGILANGNATGCMAAPSSAIVGVSDSQILSSKSMVNTFPSSGTVTVGFLVDGDATAGVSNAPSGSCGIGVSLDAAAGSGTVRVQSGGVSGLSGWVAGNTITSRHLLGNVAGRLSDLGTANQALVPSTTAICGVALSAGTTGSGFAAYLFGAGIYGTQPAGGGACAVSPYSAPISGATTWSSGLGCGLTYASANVHTDFPGVGVTTQNIKLGTLASLGTVNTVRLEETATVTAGGTVTGVTACVGTLAAPAAFTPGCLALMGTAGQFATFSGSFSAATSALSTQDIYLTLTVTAGAGNLSVVTGGTVTARIVGGVWQ